MANITRRDFLKIAGVAAGTLAAKDVLAFVFLAPVSTEDALNGNYPYLGWEVFYSEQWVFDHFGRSAHSVNCTGNCTWRAYVKNGIMYKEEQFSDYPDIGSDLPTYNPRGCQKGANHKEYVYGPQRVKYPLIRQGNLQNKALRGQGAFRRASWVEVLKLIANKVVSVIDTEWRDSAGARHKSPDQLFFYAAIPAKHHITLNGEFRLSNLLGADGAPGHRRELCREDPGASP